MKYVRTKDGRIIKIGEQTDIGYEKGTFEVHNKAGIVAFYEPIEVLKTADTIEELCDEFVAKVNIHNAVLHNLISALRLTIDYSNHELTKDYKIYGAIWTNKGLIYVAKLNEKGELELL